MYNIINRQGLFLMSTGSDIAFTADIDKAIEFHSEDAANSKIARMPLYRGLKAKIKE